MDQPRPDALREIGVRNGNSALVGKSFNFLEIGAVGSARGGELFTRKVLVSGGSLRTAFLGLRFLSAEAPADARGLFADLCAYAASWAGYALASRVVAERLGVLPRWPRFIAAWNWANVVQYLVLLGLTLPAAFGLPEVLARWLGLAALG